MRTLNINLFGGPGYGKSSTAERLSCLLRDLGHVTELVREYSKDLHWEGRLNSTEQFLITAEQWNRQARLQGRVPVAISDSAVQLGLLHAPETYRAHLEGVVRELMADWYCFDVLVERDIEAGYSNVGRQEGLPQALAHQERVRALFHRCASPAHRMVLNLNSGTDIAELAQRIHTMLI